MSDATQVRRTDKSMSEERILETISRGFAGRLATVGPNGWPYIVPLLYVWTNGEIWVHSTSAHGHLRANVDFEAKVCFEIDEPGKVFAYGRFECDTSVAYRSVIIFGRIRIIDDQKQKVVCLDALMEKYADPGWDRPKGYYPSLHQVTVYAITAERMTGKETALPAAQNLWPAVNNTKMPSANT